MSWIKRILLITTAVILFTTTALPTFAAPSPQKEDHITITTPDGVEVILWRMPEYLDKLSENGKKKYYKMLPLEPGEVLYLGEAQSGKFEGNLFNMLEMNNIDSIDVAANESDVFGQSSGVLLLASGLGIKAVKIMAQTTTTLAAGNSNSQSAAVMAEIRNGLYSAYREIKKSGGNIAQLQPGVVGKAAEAGVPLEECKVTQLFDLTVFNDAEELEKTGEMGRVRVTVVGKYDQNLVCMLHRNNGVWELVNDAKNTNGVLTFTTDTMSPFALVTWDNTGAGEATTQSPKTGDNTFAWIGAASAAVVMVTAAAYVLISAARKKRQ